MSDDPHYIEEVVDADQKSSLADNLVKNNEVSAGPATDDEIMEEPAAEEGVRRSNRKVRRPAWLIEEI